MVTKFRGPPQYQLYDQEMMRTYFKEVVKKVDRKKLPIDVLKGRFTPTLYNGTIAAGEKLIVDGRLDMMLKHVDNRIRAGDQEDSGFSQVADSRKLRWCIFRGIMDFGKPSKGDEWKFVASLSAASACIAFLRNVWP